MTEQPQDRLSLFEQRRAEGNERVFAANHLGIKRFFNLDTNAYKDSALDKRTKELLGLVASEVLRCNDCIDYHIVKCAELGFQDEEIHDALNVGLLVGGSIVIPHLRHALETLELYRKRENPEKEQE